MFLTVTIKADHDPEKIKQEVLKLLTKSQKEELVSHYFQKPGESVSIHDEIETQTRNKRLLGVEIKQSFDELVHIVIQIINSIFEKLKVLSSLYQNVGNRGMEVIESSLTIIFGKKII